jgi:hypothetical protein
LNSTASAICRVSWTYLADGEWIVMIPGRPQPDDRWLDVAPLLHAGGELVRQVPSTSYPRAPAHLHFRIGFPYATTSCKTRSD